MTCDARDWQAARAEHVRELERKMLMLEFMEMSFTEQAMVQGLDILPRTDMSLWALLGLWPTRLGLWPTHLGPPPTQADFDALNNSGDEVKDARNE